MRHRKIGGKFKKTVAVGLVVSMALGSATLRSFAKDVTEDTSTTSESDSSDKKESSVTSEEYSSERIATIYSNISKDYTASDYTGEPVTVSEENSVTAGGKKYLTTKVKGMKKATKFWICRAAKKSHLILLFRRTDFII